MQEKQMAWLVVLNVLIIVMMITLYIRTWVVNNPYRIKRELNRISDKLKIIKVKTKQVIKIIKVKTKQVIKIIKVKIKKRGVING